MSEGIAIAGFVAMYAPAVVIGGTGVRATTARFLVVGASAWFMTWWGS